jgi:hypothetical protein
VFSHDLGETPGDISVAGSVEAIPSDTVLLIEFVIKGIEVCDFWDGGMESGIETGDLFCVWQFFLRGLYAREVVRVMERRQVCEFFD